jgi:snRNA-activating protein complex subunit 3
MNVVNSIFHIHLFIRMANAGDVQNARVFPLCVFQARHAAPRCIACELQVPTKVVYEDPLASQSPAFYCDRCFDLLHKRADGSKIVPDLVEFPYFKS